MIIVLRKDISPEQKQATRKFLEDHGFKVREIVGEQDTILGAVGRLTIDTREVEILPGVDRVIPISKPYKLASRELKKEDSIINIGPVRVGGGRIAVIAGPCAVESLDQMRETAEKVREAGAVMLRGGAFKPRTSPYSFQGLGEEGLKILKQVGEEFEMPVVTEIVGTGYAELMYDYIDVFQIGARNMQNFELLKKLGSIGKPVVLKRGLSATIEEWLMAAEYLMAHGNDNVILCERGIRTFETYTRNTLDLSAIPVVRKLSHLPIIVDPSHGTGLRGKVSPMALAAIAAGADGLMVEVHPHPEQALSDGPQSLYPDQFERLMRDIEAIAPVLEKELERVPRRRRSGEAERFPAGEAKKGPVVTGKGKPAGPGGGGEDFEKTGLIAFQGMRGAYSETAVHRFFGQDYRADPRESFEDVFKAVLEGKVDYGTVPIENSLAGTVHEVLDLLLQYPDIIVVGEQKIRIIHSLMAVHGASLAGLKRVYSHPQGLAQCSRFFEDHPSIEKVPFFDTAGAVAWVAEQKDPTLGAIAGYEASQVYDVHILKEGIENNPRNYTRFFIIARTESTPVYEPNRAALVFSTQDKPGALFEVLKVLADHGLNMKKLESRPIQGKPWNYMFLVAVDMPERQDTLDEAVEAIKTTAGDVRILGRYYSHGE
jgi:3-deoxy-7-phosphoheptulonate synthase